ncbi:hypothetical protein ILUMI_10760 [Ignelater luminosus]|uniref:Uncharacterized protein n=1 Tax=Ignelater luminosus TaxID=2038154 RepID=A0A8K0CZS6_IGNLU|nr:hypothetical protein ILUMI_10760 [Ignelater luminosus]
MEDYNNHVNSTNENPVLLILDNHKSTTISYFGPFKRAYSESAENLSISNPGKVLTAKRLQDYLRLFCTAVSNNGKAEEGFEAIGISPYNPKKFTKEDLASSLFTDEEFPQVTKAMASEVIVPEEGALV